MPWTFHSYQVQTQVVLWVLNDTDTVVLGRSYQERQGNFGVLGILFLDPRMGMTNTSGKNSGFCIYDLCPFCQLYKFYKLTSFY